MVEFDRHIYLDQLIHGIDNHLIKVVTGIRRCGKSYLLFDIFNRYLLEQKVTADHIIKIALDDLSNIDLRNPINLYNFIKEKIKDDNKYFVLLDEVQYVPSFEDVLNSLLHLPNVDTYVTGSNSKFLSSDVITEFRGRGDEIRVFPLTFKEFFDAVGGDIYKRMQEYMQFGGLPIVANMEDEEKKYKYLKSVFDRIYLSDLKERYKIKNEKEFDDLLNILASGIGALSNPQKISNTFKTEYHIDINSNTIKKYIDYYCDAFLISKSLRYDVKGRKYISTPMKLYFSDLGLRNARLNFRQLEPTHIMENIIYNELIAKGYNVDVGVVEINVENNGKNQKKQLEVDFVVNKGFDRVYIQSAYSLFDSSKKEQELASLKKIPDSFSKVIITADNVASYRDENGYKIMNMYDFLLNSSNLF